MFSRAEYAVHYEPSSHALLRCLKRESMASEIIYKMEEELMVWGGWKMSSFGGFTLELWTDAARRLASAAVAVVDLAGSIDRIRYLFLKQRKKRSGGY